MCFYVGKDRLFVLQRNGVDDPFHITSVVPLGVDAAVNPLQLDWMYACMCSVCSRPHFVDGTLHRVALIFSSVLRLLISLN